MNDPSTINLLSLPFDEAQRAIRHQIKTLAEIVRGAMQHPVFSSGKTPQQDHAEMKANIMLACRHLEDAGMRLGKAIQAYDGGVSVYDKREA